MRKANDVTIRINCCNVSKYNYKLHYSVVVRIAFSRVLKNCNHTKTQ